LGSLRRLRAFNESGRTVDPAQERAVGTSVSYSLSEAATACGVHTSTLRQSIKTGRLTSTKDVLGQWRIEPDELHRVYPALRLASAI
jgi:excisionase family DNA binding protein